MSANRTVENIVDAARHTNDPERLRELSSRLNEYSAWDQAEKIQHKALEIERKQAEDV